jgi:hypothetical protein
VVVAIIRHGLAAAAPFARLCAWASSALSRSLLLLLSG